jgi:hypothetical protein
MDDDPNPEGQATDAPEVPEWISNPLSWVSRPLIPRGYIAADTAACVVVALDLLRMFRDFVKVRSTIHIGPSSKTWEHTNEGVYYRVWHPDYWWDELETGRNGVLIQLRFRKSPKWLKPMAPRVFIGTPMGFAWPYLEFQSRAIAVGARMAFQSLRSDLSDGQLTGKLINNHDGDVVEVPLERWDTGAFGLALWTGDPAAITVAENENRGRLVFETSEFENYLSSRDGQSWQFCREKLGLRLTQAEADKESEAEEDSEAPTKDGSPATDSAPLALPCCPPADNLPTRPRRSRPESDRAERALAALYPAGMPDRGLVSNMDLQKQVNDWLKAKGMRAQISYTTVLRASGRRDRTELGRNGSNGNAAVAELAKCDRDLS